MTLGAVHEPLLVVAGAEMGPELGRQRSPEPSRRYAPWSRAFAPYRCWLFIDGCVASRASGYCPQR